MVNSRERNIYETTWRLLQIDKHNLVYKLNKSLYGRKQSPWVWYAHVNTYLLQSGFEQNIVDTNVYVKRVGRLFVAIPLYGDDYIIVTNDHKKKLPQTIALLCVEFDVWHGRNKILYWSSS